MVSIIYLIFCPIPIFYTQVEKKFLLSAYPIELEELNIFCSGRWFRCRNPTEICPTYRPNSPTTYDFAPIMNFFLSDKAILISTIWYEKKAFFMLYKIAQSKPTHLLWLSNSSAAKCTCGQMRPK
jgi:hypothetical protein